MFKVTNHLGVEFSCQIEVEGYQLWIYKGSQFIASYYTKTIKEMPEDTGLNLRMGDPELCLTPDNIAEIKEHIC